MEVSQYFEWEKPKLISFLFPSVSSMRGTGKNHNTRSRVDAVLCFRVSQSFVLLQNTACMQKLSGSHSQASGRSVCTWTEEAPQQLRVSVWIPVYHSVEPWGNQEQNSYVLLTRRQNTPIRTCSMFGVRMWLSLHWTSPIMNTLVEKLRKS